MITIFFFYFFVSCLGFLSQPFTNHRTVGEGGGHFFNSSLPLPLASQTLRHEIDDIATVDYDNDNNLKDLDDIDLKKTSGTQIAAKKIVKKYKKCHEKTIPENF